MNTLMLNCWKRFCEGAPLEHAVDFSTLFYELYVYPMTKARSEVIREVLCCVPNGVNAMESIVRLGARPKAADRDEIEDLVRLDLSRFLDYIDNSAVRSAVSLGVCAYLDGVDSESGEEAFASACECALNQEFLSIVSHQFCRTSTRLRNSPAGALFEAFYGIDLNVRTQVSLASLVIPDGLDHAAYLELAALYCDYAVTENGIVIGDFRRKRVSEFSESRGDWD